MLLKANLNSFTLAEKEQIEQALYNLIHQNAKFSFCERVKFGSHKALSHLFSLEVLKYKALPAASALGLLWLASRDEMANLMVRAAPYGAGMLAAYGLWTCTNTKREPSSELDGLIDSLQLLTLDEQAIRHRV